MNKQFNKINLLAAILVLGVLIATPVFAQTTLGEKKTGATLTAIITKADKEIDQRIKSLTDLSSRIGEMKKISSDEKNSFSSTIQNEINQLSALKIKIDADTDAITAKTDYQTITKSYRIYALVMPQIRIVAAADRIITIADSMDAVSSKIQTRIASMTGTDATSATQLLSDFNTKVSDAKTQANAAIQEVLTLQPDQGDQTKMQANTTVLKDASAKIKTGISDLIAARKDAGTIVKNLNNIKSNADIKTEP